MAYLPQKTVLNNAIPDRYNLPISYSLGPVWLILDANIYHFLKLGNGKFGRNKRYDYTCIRILDSPHTSFWIKR